MQWNIDGGIGSDTEIRINKQLYELTYFDNMRGST